MGKINWNTKKGTAIRREIMKRFGGNCFFCGRRPGNWWGFEIDHLLPISLGGLTQANNLIPICKWCNSSKGAYTLDRWSRTIEKQKLSIEEELFRLENILTEIKRAKMMLRDRNITEENFFNNRRKYDVSNKYRNGA